MKQCLYLNFAMAGAFSLKASPTLQGRHFYTGDHQQHRLSPSLLPAGFGAETLAARPSPRELVRSVRNSDQSLDLGQPDAGADPSRLMVSGISWEGFQNFFYFPNLTVFVTHGVELLLVVIYL